MKFSSNEIKERGAIFSPEAFKRPATDYYPAFAWSWCDPIDRDEVMRQLDYMCENNIKIVYILPEPKDFRPKTAPTNLEPDYLSEEYFEIYRFAAEYAAKNATLAVRRGRLAVGQRQSPRCKGQSAFAQRPH